MTDDDDVRRLVLTIDIPAQYRMQLDTLASLRGCEQEDLIAHAFSDALCALLRQL